MSANDHGASTQGPAGQPRLPPNACAELLERLAGRPAAEARYEVIDEVGRGGMGRVLRVHDRDLHRELAMKVLLDASGRELGTSPTTPSQHRARFLEEAQVAGQLDHPGIVPIHDVGLTEEGRLFFTMKLVRGRTLQELVELHGKGEWSLTRLVGVVLRVVEAMDYAHERGVVHRDLKPSNVMVGRHGEVYVMDWGLAHLVGTRETSPRDHTDVYSVRRDSAASETPGTFVTDYGVVVGTPSFLPPERALPEGSSSAKTDIYAVGAMLYTVIAGMPPYASKSERVDNHHVWLALQQGPPAPLAKLAPDVPAELVAITEKAMARDVTQRYASMREFATDLHAYLEQRVVRAHRTGAWAELQKWIARNRATAAAIGVGVLAVASAGFVVAHQQETLAAERYDRLRDVEREAREAAILDLPRRADRLWPVAPERLPELRVWLDDARRLGAWRVDYVRFVEEYEREHANAPRKPLTSAEAALHDEYRLDALREKQKVFSEQVEVLSQSDSPPPHARHDVEVMRIELADLPRQIAHEQRLHGRWRDWVYAEPEVEGAYAHLRAVRDVLEDVAAGDGELRASVEQRLVQAESLLTIAPGVEGPAWEQVALEVKSDARFPQFAARPLPPQLGLVPLGRDPASGLQEFWHVLSGTKPVRGPNGRWQVGADTGIVLVLVPGGAGWMRAQDTDPGGKNYVAPDDDPNAPNVVREMDGRSFVQLPYYLAPARPPHGRLSPNELGPIAYDLAPYFLAKHELTQGQWLRLAGYNPSDTWAGSQKKAQGVIQPRITRAHPVELVAWNDATSMLSRWSLELPTEAQFEHACRAGTSALFPWGDDVRGRRGRANWADLSGQKVDVASHGQVDFDDGYPLHAPVDAFEPNPWGFHSLAGNVSEWCRDWFAAKCEAGHLLPGTGEHRPAYATQRSVRGGSYRSTPDLLRLTRRYGFLPDETHVDLGVRASRALDGTTL